MNRREYNKIHQWNLRHWVKTGSCEFCKQTEKRTVWSNKSGNYIRFDKSDWQELCDKCHMWYDINVLKVDIGGKRSIPTSKRKEIGRLGGLKSRGGGFSSATPEQRAEWGRRGGLKKKEDYKKSS